jgi:hypothetical protein
MQTEIEYLVERYLAEKHRFKKNKDIFEDVNGWIDLKTKGNSWMSKKFIDKIHGKRISEHYKIAQTHFTGIIKCTKKKEPRIVLFKCNYIRSDKGLVYFYEDQFMHRLHMFSGHFFDRFAERHLEREHDIEANRHIAVSYGVSALHSSTITSDVDPLMLDREFGEAYYIFSDDGYAAGEFMELPAGNKLNNENKPTTVCFFKTFLSHEEVSPASMDRLIELYRINKEKKEEYQNGAKDNSGTGEFR